ncbi:MAG TPA: hypothetical protein VK766_05775 [Cytophagaceae bacterium]|nr:hypothetical protein [Cytophagaceae bacterium]
MIRIPGIKKGDWRAVTFCVFAAITFWFFNAMTINYSIDVAHPVVIHYDEDQYVPLEDLPTQIRFSTTASGWDIFTKTSFVNSTPIELELDDFKKRKYITAARLKTIVAKQMSGIQINEILDDTLYVNFDKIKSKKVKLRVDAKKLSLEEGYYLAGQILVEPSEIMVSGPVSLIKSVPDFVSVKIDSKNISGKFEEEVTLETSLDKRIRFDKNKVKVKLETYQLEKVEKELKISKLNFPKRRKIKLSEEYAVFVYYAKAIDLPLVELQKMEAQVDFFSMNEKDESIKITLKKVPELIQQYRFEPKTIKISYDR